MNTSIPVSAPPALARDFRLLQDEEDLPGRATRLQGGRALNLSMKPFLRDCRGRCRRGPGAGDPFLHHFGDILRSGSNMLGNLAVTPRNTPAAPCSHVRRARNPPRHFSLGCGVVHVAEGEV